MRSTFLALTLAALATMCWPTPEALAQEEKIARGKVTALGGASMSVKVGDHEMNFSVDHNTIVQAPGGSTKTRKAQELGKPGPRLADVLRVGQGVAVNYKDMGGNLHASVVRAVPTAAAHGTSAATAAPAEKKSNGVVKSMAADSITISGSIGGGGSFEQTFTIDRTTTVYGKGASTLTASMGGRAPFGDLVKNGDRVSVAYHEQGDALHASNVRVMAKGTLR